MQINIDPSALAREQWHEYAVRFFFGGLVTAIAGVIAKEFGPGTGGLFLAFPAIFPASATLIEKHEKQLKKEQGLRGAVRGREAASADAAGAAMGSIGLFLFAMMVWRFLPNHSSWLVLPGATLAWLIVSVLIWRIRELASPHIGDQNL